MLNRLRVERGLKQNDLIGPGLSASYLSRLESGERPATPHVVAHLSKRLGVQPGSFASHVPANSLLLLAKGTAALNSGTTEEAARLLADAADSAELLTPEMSALQWPIHWQLVQVYDGLGEYRKNESILSRLLEHPSTRANPLLRIQVLVKLSETLRNLGKPAEAVAAVEEAWSARESLASVELGDSLHIRIAAAAAHTEAGQHVTADMHSSWLLEHLGEAEPHLQARILWVAASCRIRRGAAQEGLKLLVQAVARLDSRVDPLLWARLRLAAVALHLRVSPKPTEELTHWLAQARSALTLIGEPRHLIELSLMEARLAYANGEPAPAARLLDEVLAEAKLLSHRDRTQAEILRLKVSAQLDDPAEAVRGLRVLAGRLEQGGHFELAGDVWRTASEIALPAESGHE
ncbi:helix-turn-helix transcriptional regulator [Kitasatospora purpeofusca]|uniref:Helix-turn-helix domain-containing protein n=1 Tax=Kitasatospora purpeofusca TaxID=67352 RepID=A0ABZ1U8C9_9ACTN|nr:helix-turn-helix transcriptional regulator [Kitasatospora purpeofusca]